MSAVAFWCWERRGWERDLECDLSNPKSAYRTALYRQIKILLYSQGDYIKYFCDAQELNICILLFMVGYKFKGLISAKFYFCWPQAFLTLCMFFWGCLVQVEYCSMCCPTVVYPLFLYFFWNIFLLSLLSKPVFHFLILLLNFFVRLLEIFLHM